MRMRSDQCVKYARIIGTPNASCGVTGAPETETQTWTNVEADPTART
jgi:hypothetical protein